MTDQPRDPYTIPVDFDIEPFIVGKTETFIVANGEPRRPLRPNVTPETPPIIRLIPLIAIIVASIPWFVGAWQIGRWILK